MKPVLQSVSESVSRAVSKSNSWMLWEVSDRRHPSTRTQTLTHTNTHRNHTHTMSIKLEGASVIKDWFHTTLKLSATFYKCLQVFVVHILIWLVICVCSCLCTWVCIGLHVVCFRKCLCLCVFVELLTCGSDYMYISIAWVLELAIWNTCFLCSSVGYCGSWEGGIHTHTHTNTEAGW